MPVVLRVGGYRFFFFSNESEEPVHIHVSKGSGIAKLWINPVRLANSKGFKPKELNVILQMAEEHRALIEEKWHDYFK